MITIIDYGMGNLGSIKNMLRKIDIEAEITSESHKIQKAEKLILPGVGAFDNGMKNIQELGILPILNQKVLEEKVPVLGICLGMQLMTEKSEEGVLPGLGWIKGETKKFQFPSPSSLKIPHMGWNNIKIVQEGAMTQGLNDKSRFYFVHSYRVVPEKLQDILFKTNYGGDFCSAFLAGNIIGVQFHPEKSHKFGMALLKNFAAIKGGE